MGPVDVIGSIIALVAMTFEDKVESRIVGFWSAI